MNTYEVREQASNEAWFMVDAESPTDAINVLIAINRWYIEEGKTELIEVRQVNPTPVTLLALLPDGQITEVI